MVYFEAGLDTVGSEVRDDSFNDADVSTQSNEGP